MLLEVRAAIAVLIEGGAVFDDDHGGARRVRAVPWGEQLVHPVGVSGPRGVAHGGEQTKSQRNRQAAEGAGCGKGYGSGSVGVVPGRHDGMLPREDCLKTKKQRNECVLDRMNRIYRIS